MTFSFDGSYKNERIELANARKEVSTLDTQLRVHTAVVAVLSGGAREGSALLHEATLLLGWSPPLDVWRNALIVLTQEGTIMRTIIRDDDENVLGVSFQLPEQMSTTEGEDDGLPSPDA